MISRPSRYRSSLLLGSPVIALALGAGFVACGGSGSSDPSPGGGGGTLLAGSGGASAGKAGTGGGAGKAGAGGNGGSIGGSGGSGGGSIGGSGGSGGSIGGSGRSGGGGAKAGGSGAAGAPTCLPPTTSCPGGKCVDLTADVGNCGACGKTCGGGELCCASTCAGAVSCAFAVLTASPASGWQNGGDFVTLTGNGFVPGSKVFFADGRAPAWVKDAHTIVVQTPPHPVGAVDVIVTKPGGGSTTLKSAFTYAASDVTLPWQQVSMSAVRGEGPGVTTLRNGKVLVAGGTTVPDDPSKALTTAEVFDRATTKTTLVANAMSAPRWRTSAVALLDGRALVVGGACSSVDAVATCNGNATLADLYDPATNQFAPTAKPTNVPRAFPHSVLMGDGRVFVSSSNEGSIELYDPVLDSFKLVAHAQAHPWGYVVRLRDGRVMMLGGDGKIDNAGLTGRETEIFDPDTETFSPVQMMMLPRSLLTAHTLPDGRVLAVGGTAPTGGDPASFVLHTRIDVWDPTTATWALLPPSVSITGRAWHASALIRDGSVLVLGGYATMGTCTPSALSERIDLGAGTVAAFGTLPTPNAEWNAVTMLDGSVLAVGGGACGTAVSLPDLDFLPGKLLAQAPERGCVRLSSGQLHILLHDAPGWHVPPVQRPL